MADPSSGRLVTALALDRRVRVLVAVIDGPAREMCRRHALQGGAAVAASEGLVSATLLSSQLKGREQLSLNIHGEQPEFRFVADVRGGIAVRARLDCPRALPDAGLRFDGLVAMHKFLEDKELYRGMAEVADGTLVEALQGGGARICRVQRALAVRRRARIRRLQDELPGHRGPKRYRLGAVRGPRAAPVLRQGRARGQPRTRRRRSRRSLRRR